VVDVLLDAAAMGINTVEREGISLSHPARFTLVGTMNPEEGELRPQLLDRFGLCVSIKGIEDTVARVEVMERRVAFEENPERFCREWETESAKLRRRIHSAIRMHSQVTIDRGRVVAIAERCKAAEVDGHRADIITLKAAKAVAAWNGRTEVEDGDVETAARLALPHRMRRLPFEDIGNV
jgi:magnesium chelatase subunit I